MSSLTRRRFVTSTGSIVAAATALTAARQSLGRSAGEQIVLGFIGVGGRGAQHVEKFAARKDVEIAYLCDADQNRMAAPLAKVELARQRAPKVVDDLRRVLDDRSVDAVVISTPDHWHALATIWACQAGKDVYVEKPVANGPWEGRKMVEAARKYNRIVQGGTQNRSAAYNIKAKQYIDSGKLGRIEFVRVFNQKPGANFGWLAARQQPKGLDWNLWNGPAPEQSYDPTLHQNWHAFWRYGGGEVTNDGVHQMDLARWLVGVDYPKSVHAVGRPFAEKGAAEIPDTIITTFEFPELVMTLEQTLYAPYMLKESQQVRDGDIFPYWPQNATRIEIYGSKAMMIVGRHGGGWQVLGRQKGQEPVVLDQIKGRFPDKEHHQNFLECVRSRQRPTADVEEGHISALLCHAANISYRVGNVHLMLDRKRESFTNSNEANQLLKPIQRPPFVVPEQV